MTNEFTAIVERDGEWYITYCPEVPGANGQGKTKEEALESLSEAIALILEDRREEGLRGVPPDATLDKVTRERERKRGQICFWLLIHIWRACLCLADHRTFHPCK
ncbi:MAG: type II toxin-antitoxin system HicB family antitoxin [Candidatus Methylomirabilales bacterium]|jgi:predicted RNase H-like HicB family nuclease